MTERDRDKLQRESVEEIGPRHAAVLKQLVREHIRAGEPVSSGRLAQAGEIDLSAASIRHVLAELESMGLLVQPHTSSGRIPTDLGYRHYVDRCLETPRPMAARSAARIEDALARSRGDLPDLLEQASKQLSRLSKQVGLVMAPRLDRWVLDRVEFMRVDHRRILAVLIGRHGFVHHRMLEVDLAPTADHLERVGRYLTVNFGGKSLYEMREAIASVAQEERAALDALVAESVRLGDLALSTELETELFVEGATNLLGLPDFQDLEVLQSLFRTLDERRMLMDLLSRLLDGEGVQTVIGQENPVEDLNRCSLITSSFGTGDRVVGSLGIVGPTRMDYGRAIALVGHLALVIGNYLDPGEEPS